LDTNQTPDRAATPRAPWRPALIALAATLIAVLAIPGSALAARGLTTGFQSDYYQSPDASVRNLWFQKTVGPTPGSSG
jgi:hypothetical protein